MSSKGDYIVIESETLKQKAAYDKRSGRLYCEDRTIYSPNELFWLNFAKQEIPLAVHLVKKVFGGEVVSVPYSAACKG